MMLTVLNLLTFVGGMCGFSFEQYPILLPLIFFSLEIPGLQFMERFQCISFSNAFFENLYTLNLKLSNKFVFQFYWIMSMFDECLKLKFRSRTQAVWWNASSEYWTGLLRYFWPMQLIAPIVKFLLLISKNIILFDYFCFSCEF